MTLAQTGITTAGYLKVFFPSVPRSAAQIVISLGVNDDPTMPTLDNLRVLRRGLHGSQIVWLLPGLKPAVRQAIMVIAQEAGDRLVDTQPQTGPDHLHPTGTGYRLIASWTQDLSGHAVTRGVQRYAAIDAPLVNQPRGGSIEPNMSGNLRQYREMPVVVYPNTFNGRVIYGLSANAFTAFRARPSPQVRLPQP